MKAKALRLQIAALEELLADWIRFHGIFEEYSEISEMSPDDFLEFKNRIARGQDVLMNALEFEIEIGQMMMDIISRVSSPQYLSTLSEISRTRLESEWNTAFIFINETIGLLEKKLEHQIILSRPDKMVIHLLRSSGKGLIRLLQSTWFKVLCFLIIIVLIIYGVFALGIISREDLPEFVQPLIP